MSYKWTFSLLLKDRILYLVSGTYKAYKSKISNVLNILNVFYTFIKGERVSFLLEAYDEVFSG